LLKIGESFEMKIRDLKNETSNEEEKKKNKLLG